MATKFQFPFNIQMEIQHIFQFSKLLLHAKHFWQLNDICWTQVSHAIMGHLRQWISTTTQTAQTENVLSSQRQSWILKSKTSLYFTVLHYQSLCWNEHSYKAQRLETQNSTFSSKASCYQKNKGNKTKLVLHPISFSQLKAKQDSKKGSLVSPPNITYHDHPLLLG